MLFEPVLIGVNRHCHKWTHDSNADSSCSSLVLNGHVLWTKFSGLHDYIFQNLNEQVHHCSIRYKIISWAFVSFWILLNENSYWQNWEMAVCKLWSPTFLVAEPSYFLETALVKSCRAISTGIFRSVLYRGLGTIYHKIINIWLLGI